MSASNVDTICGRLSPQLLSSLRVTVSRELYVINKVSMSGDLNQNLAHRLLRANKPFLFSELKASAGETDSQTYGGHVKHVMGPMGQLRNRVLAARTVHRELSTAVSRSTQQFAAAAAAVATDAETSSHCSIRLRHSTDQSDRTSHDKKS